MGTRQTIPIQPTVASFDPSNMPGPQAGLRISEQTNLLYGIEANLLLRPRENQVPLAAAEV